LAFLRQPIDYGALDKKRVNILFAIVSTTVHVHLLLLSHLMYALQNSDFRRLLDTKAMPEELLKTLKEIENHLENHKKAEDGTP
jgi:PTS system nitrogen regulatory IIA component